MSFLLCQKNTLGSQHFKLSPPPKNYKIRCIRVQISCVFGTKTKTMFSVNNYHTRENQLSSICNCKVEANINFCFCLLPERKLLPASPQGISPDATFLSQIKKLQFWSRKEVSECTLQSKSSLSALKVILEAVQAPQNFSPALLWALGYTMPKYLFLFYLTSRPWSKHGIS